MTFRAEDGIIVPAVAGGQRRAADLAAMADCHLCISRVREKARNRLTEEEQ
jgi:alpha-D-ribose 1-methylphosphonate 5-triphosphate synthase subunit PhnG